MTYENVKLWFAKDENEKIITVDEINEDNKKNTYLCPVCGSNLKPKAIKSKQITSHFAHVDASKCNSESQIHFWFKHRFIEKGDKFTVVADKVREYVCKDIQVEKPYEVGDKIYKPDVTILTECGNTIYFEMAFSNKKKVKDYLDMWLELKNIVVEIDIKQLMFKDEMPTFKALFYDGKCFNTKKNDTYYNTIGKYKEEKLKGKFDNELKERIRKLDWFWDDVFRYKKGEVDIEYMTDLIDSIDYNEKEITFKILSKKSCNEIYKDYLNFKQDCAYKVLKDQFDLNNKHYSITKSGFIDSWHDKYLTKKIEFRNLLENEYSGLDIRKYSIQEIIEKVNKYIVSIEKSIQHKKDLEFAKNNVVLKSVIEDINSKFKKEDEKYHFYDRFCFDRYVSFCYNCNTLIDFKLPKEIVYSTDKNTIYKFLMDKINQYINTVEPFKNEEFIISVLDVIKERYKHVIFNKEKHSYQKKIGKRKYETMSEMRDIKYLIDYKLIAQDLIYIKTRKEKSGIFGGYTNDFCIYKNKFFQVNSDYKLLEDLSNGEAKFIKLIQDWNDLQNIIQTSINSYIESDLNCICVDCEEEYNIKSGEIDFFIKNNLSIPRRCKSCRDKRKQNK